MARETRDQSGAGRNKRDRELIGCALVSSSFLERGGLWVLGQSILMSAVAVVAVVFSDQLPWMWVRYAGGVFILAGAVFGTAGVVALKGSRTAFPQPREDSRLIEQGIYAHVRHPLYTSVALICLGWTMMWGSAAGLGLGFVLIPFLRAKARREEELLRRKFPGYTRYEQRVSRFIPWLC
jgi:protein-S-isoprenylcysteine O-methyltransferase Ste14